MRHDTDRLFRTLVWGVFSLALGATCLLVRSRLAQDDLSLSELISGTGHVLMSCADDDSAGGEPMWCSNPESPHCIPALPKPPAPEAVQGTVATLLSTFIAPAPLDLGVLTVWPTPPVERTRSLQLSHPLERPPRLV